jgi:pimeloyl-ACP methyl ester carboxylesterase
VEVLYPSPLPALSGDRGRLERFDRKYSVADQAALICRFIRQHNLTNLTLIGHSFGGGVALLTSVYFTTQTPQRLQRLILIDSAAYPQSLPFFIKLPSIPLVRNLVFAFTSNEFLVRSSLKQAFYDDTKIEPSAVSTYAEPLNTPNGRHALIEVTKQLANLELGDMEEKFREIDIPTLIIWGQYDTVTPLSIGQRLEKAIPQSRLVVLEDCGHIPHEEAPQRTLATIQEFLEPVSSEGR